MNVMRYIILLFLCKNIALSYALVTFSNYTLQSKYQGENFPEKYLIPEIRYPNILDLQKYLSKLRSIVDYFDKSPNSTDCTTLIVMSYVKVILARTVSDYRDYIDEQELNTILNAMRKCANIVSRFIFKHRKYGWENYEFRVSEIFINDEAQFHSLSAFNKGRFKKWLRSNCTLHNYSKEMDNVTLPKQKYVEIIVLFRGFYATALDSDICLSNIAYTPEPTNVTNMQPCRPEQHCFEYLHASPSIAYTLSHRLLNVLLRHQTRRCYLVSPEDDVNHMDMLCAFMYREAVYVARQGFFARDIFMEHIALCALLGYEEFHRRQWFNKVSSWIDEQGCVKENLNYRYNKTYYMIKYTAGNMKEVDNMRKDLRRRIVDKCHRHPMALTALVMAHGIRYAVYRKSLNN